MPSPAGSEFDFVGSARPQLLTRTRPIDPSILASTGIDLAKAVIAEVQTGTELYGLVTSHLASDKSGATTSFTIGIGSAKRGGCCGSDPDPDDCEHYRNTATDLGLGFFEKEYKGETVHFLHQTLGDVVGTDCGATLLRSLVLIAPSITTITSFCDELIAEADKTSSFKFNVYRFHVQHQYWRRSETVEARPLESVVLPSELKRKIVEDLDEFISLDSKKWYRAHGIPYKRSYLLHGAPGAGKTSLIQALAGRYKRNVCFLSPSHPDFTDDALKAAVQRVPRDSIIVLEDIDGLGAAHRDPKKKGDEKSSLTFSGMLNALDGVGGQHGQIFVLTTNHRENLDPALIRNGRVDLHVEFTDATEEQMIGLFKSFYVSADEALAKSFASELLELLGERTVSCAALQHYFITARKLGAEEAAKGAKKVIEEMEAHGKYAKDGGVGEKKKEEVVEADEEKKTPSNSKGKEEVEANGETSNGKTGACEATGSGKVVHLHIH
jgi:chaperone BCS1